MRYDRGKKRASALSPVPMKRTILGALCLTLALTACLAISHTPPAKTEMDVVALKWISAEQGLDGLRSDSHLHLHNRDLLKVSADPRTNSLLVVATPDDMATVKERIAELDVKPK